MGPATASSTAVSNPWPLRLPSELRPKWAPTGSAGGFTFQPCCFMTAVLKYTPWPELSVITASRSPKMRSSSSTFGDGRLCSSASKPANSSGVVGSVVATASAKIASASDQAGASHGAIERAGGWVAIPLITG